MHFLAEREGFEPSIELLTLYSLSRGAPSASRAPLRFWMGCDQALAAIRPETPNRSPDSCSHRILAGSGFRRRNNRRAVDALRISRPAAVSARRTRSARA